MFFISCFFLEILVMIFDKLSSVGRKNNKKFNKTLTHDFLVDKIKETMTNRN